MGTAMFDAQACAVSLWTSVFADVCLVGGAFSSSLSDVPCFYLVVRGMI
jgi:hypothetical protein